MSANIAGRRAANCTYACAIASSASRGESDCCAAEFSAVERSTRPTRATAAAKALSVGKYRLGATPTVADSLIERGITVNTINPGPTDTGWASADLNDFFSRHMPRGRWNSPEEAAAVVAMLLSPDSGSITGQVIGAEGGFRRFTP
ncbi:SDR family oxidoreductase [Rhodococcus sp. PML026]|uniref:SDR family oxidoreductase n=1 Tax=Rhodococcus sp. PML026 TaxID=1356405 RepID=UPI003FA777AB